LKDGSVVADLERDDQVVRHAHKWIKQRQTERNKELQRDTEIYIFGVK